MQCNAMRRSTYACWGKPVSSRPMTSKDQSEAPAILGCSATLQPSCAACTDPTRAEPRLRWFSPTLSAHWHHDYHGKDNNFQNNYLEGTRP